MLLRMPAGRLDRGGRSVDAEEATGGLAPGIEGGEKADSAADVERRPSGTDGGRDAPSDFQIIVVSLAIEGGNKVWSGAQIIECNFFRHPALPLALDGLMQRGNILRREVSSLIGEVFVVGSEAAEPPGFQVFMKLALYDVDRHSSNVDRPPKG